MAYAGFQKLCGVLWTSTSPKLLTKPTEWAKQLLESFKLQHLDYRVTRRSAGVPFYLQVRTCVDIYSITYFMYLGLLYIIIGNLVS